MLTIEYLNTWGGSLWDSLHSHYCAARDVVDIFCLQEVHRYGVSRSRPIVVSSNGGELVNNSVRSIVCNQMDMLDRYILRSYRVYFAGHFPSLHDEFVGDLPVEFGNAIFVRRDINVVSYRSAMVYRYYGEQRDECPAARCIQAVTILREGVVYVIVNFHGLWLGPGRGKGDCSERSDQSTNVCNFIAHCVRQAGQDTGQVPKVILGGDFNLHSGTRALQRMVADTRVFGKGGAVHLNKAHAVMDARTSYYKKAEREATHVLVSPGVQVQCFEAFALPEVSDHRIFLLTCR